MSWQEALKSYDVPDGECGKWKIEHFDVSEDQARFQNMRASFSFSERGRYISPGRYMRLLRHRTLVMSNTPAEIRDASCFLWRARGNVLIHGLGLGCTVAACLGKPEVATITVVEIDPNVIDLVGPSLADPRVSIMLGDAFTWQPPRGRRWDVVWHDIWDNICGDNWPEIKRLHRRFGRRCDFQSSWCRAEMRRAAE